MQNVVGGYGIATGRIDAHDHALNRRVIFHLLQQFDEARSGEAFIVGRFVSRARRDHSLPHDQRHPASASGHGVLTLDIGIGRNPFQLALLQAALHFADGLVLIA